jgi:hypothetical protein
VNRSMLSPHSLGVRIGSGERIRLICRLI